MRFYSAQRLSAMKNIIYMSYKLEMVDVREKFHTQYIKGKVETKMKMAKPLILKV